MSATHFKRALPALLAASCFAGVGFLASPAPTSAEPGRAPPRTVVLDPRFAPLPDTLGDGVQEFVDTLEGFSRLEVTFATPSRGAGILNAVNAGEIDMGIDILTLQASGNPALDQILDLYGESVPFGPGVDRYVAWLTIGGGLDQLKRIMVREYGYHPCLEIVPVIANTGQAAAMSKIELTRESFTAGFLMRTFGFGRPAMARAFPNMKFIEAAGGAAPQIVAGFEGTLSMGCPTPPGGPCELQAAEFVNPCIDQKLIYKEIKLEANLPRFYYTTQWQSPATISFLFYRTDRFSREELATIRVAQVVNVLESRTRLQRSNEKCLRELERDYNQEIRELPDDVLEDLRHASRDVLQDVADANEDFGRVLRSLQRFGQRR